MHWILYWEYIPIFKKISFLVFYRNFLVCMDVCMHMPLHSRHSKFINMASDYHWRQRNIAWTERNEWMFEVKQNGWILLKLIYWISVRMYENMCWSVYHYLPWNAEGDFSSFNFNFPLLCAFCFEVSFPT